MILADLEGVVLKLNQTALAHSILQEGFPIIIKDRSLYLRFYLLISTAAEDFHNFVKNFWRIKNRTGGDIVCPLRWKVIVY